MRTTKAAALPGVLAAALILLGSCAAGPSGTADPVSPAAGQPYSAVTLSSGGVGEKDSRFRYTRADYALLQSLRTEGYRDRKLADFNAALLDWTDEDAYHKVEDALRRLSFSLPSDDPLFGFLHSTVDSSWGECRVRHYNACGRDQRPSVWDEAEWEKLEDVFGDQVPVEFAWAEYGYRYAVADENTLTVGERDDFIAGVAQGMQDFLNGRTDAQRKDEEGMKKALQAELARLTGTLGGTRIAAECCEVDYRYEDAY